MVVYNTSHKKSFKIRLASFVFLLICAIANAVPIAAKKNAQLTSSKLHLLLLQYEHAKQVYQQGYYIEAKSLLEELIKNAHQSALAPYIHFYYALSAYHNGEKELATQIFSEISLAYPLWDKKDEIHYWLAQCKFEEGIFSEALKLLAVIQDKKMYPSILQMKDNFLTQIESCGYLQELLEEFPNDPIIREILYKKAACQAYITQDFSLVNILKTQCNGFNDKYDPLRSLKSKRKERYRIALFLPLFVEEFDYETCTNQFVIDLYQGIQLAIETLAQEGITIDLFSFDTKKDATVTKELLTQEELQHIDLIIGPLYPATIPLINAFATKHKINYVNPISKNASIINNSPFAFLFQPSLETYAKKAAQLTLNDIENQSIENPAIAVFYGNTSEDIVQATTYKKIIEQELGKELLLFMQLADQDIKDFFDNTTKPEEESKIIQEGNISTQHNKENNINELDLTKITHIYVPSQHELLVSSAINLALKLKITPLLIGNEEWIKKGIITLNQLKTLPLLFLWPSYIDFNKPDLIAFRKNFLYKTATQPNQESYIGYEMMLFFGRMLATYGTYFQKEWENIYYKGNIFQGVSYGRYHCNQHIPVLRFTKNKFVVEDDLLPISRK